MNQFGIIEFLGLMTGVTAIGFGIWQYTITWPLSVVSNAFFAYLFWQSGRYADVSFRMLFISIAFYGWYLWRRDPRGTDALRVSPLDPRIALTVSVASVVSGAGIWTLLKVGSYQGNIFDIVALVLALAAQYSLARKYIESWYVLLVSDILSIGVYYTWHFYFLALLSVLTFGMCLVGLSRWKAAKLFV